MAEPINEIEFNLDFYRRSPIKLNWYPVQNDSQTYKFVVTPYKDEELYILDAGWTYTISVTRPNGTKVIDNATVESDKIVYILGSSFLEQYGMHKCTIEIFDGTKRLTSNQFIWETIEETGGDDAITNTNEYPVYSEMLDHLDDEENPHSVTAMQVGLSVGIEQVIEIEDKDGNIHTITFGVGGTLASYTIT
ncbi:MAG: BppU family phage baseplate upper protein [Methanogenium sp.]